MSASFPTYQPRLLYIDLFCGAGGVTTGVSRVPGVQVVACVNHDATAIASHAANHPDALHYTEDIRTLDISPIAARVAMLRLRYPDTKVVLWASCECTNFSRAKGGKTRDPDSRSLAEHLYRYIKALQPDYIQIENVTEFLEWGPMLEKDGKLVPDMGIFLWREMKRAERYERLYDDERKKRIDAENKCSGCEFVRKAHEEFLDNRD